MKGGAHYQNKEFLGFMNAFEALGPHFMPNSSDLPDQAHSNFSKLSRIFEAISKWSETEKWCPSSSEI